MASSGPEETSPFVPLVVERQISPLYPVSALPPNGSWPQVLPCVLSQPPSHTVWSLVILNKPSTSLETLPLHTLSGPDTGHSLQGSSYRLSLLLLAILSLIVVIIIENSYVTLPKQKSKHLTCINFYDPCNYPMS